MNEARKLRKSRLTKQLTSALRTQVIDLESPGPLLKDIEKLIAAIGSGMPTTSSYFALPQGRLCELNLSLSAPLPHELKRPQLRSFPALTGLFSLLRGCGLAVGESKPRRVVLIDPDIHRQFNEMNSTERYMNLLSAWFWEAGLGSVGLEMRPTSGRGMHRSVCDAYQGLNSPVTHITDDRYCFLNRFESAVTLSMFYEFGWVRLFYDETPAAGKAAGLRRIERTMFGDAMFAITCKLDSDNEKHLDGFGEVYKAFFPEWKRDWVEPGLEYREGNYSFKVAFGTSWRRMVVPSDATFKNLAYAILDAFRFDDSHLYQFELFDRRGNAILILGPHLDDGEYLAEELQIGELPFLLGNSMVFHYDFGDDWEFKVTLESIDENPSGKKQIKVTSKSGAAPKQYDRNGW